MTIADPGPGPLPGWLAPLTQPCAWAYAYGVAHRNRRYDDPRHVRTVGVPVVSVGNLTVGGTGKTPVVQWLARELLARDRRPGIAMRGYGATGDTPADEVLLHRRTLPDVPVAADPDRARAIRERLLTLDPPVDVVLLDDGFQHRRLHRDLDLVLVDATRPGLRDHVLPAGYLREPVANLRRADAVIITRAGDVDPALAEAVLAASGHPPLAWTRHAWSGLDLHHEAGTSRESVDWLRGRQVATIFGVGHPAPLLDAVEQAGATVVVNVPARDHERYGRARATFLRGVAASLDALLTTAKDWVKLEPLIDPTSWPTPIVVPCLTLEVIAGEAELLKRVMAALARPAPERGPEAR